MSTTRRAALALAALLLSPGAGAQERLAGPLRWEDCVNIALLRNPELASSRRSLEAARAAYNGSFNGVMPNLTLSSTFKDHEGFGGAEADRWAAGATASIDLINAASIAGIRSAAASQTQAQASVREASATLRFELRRAFAQLLFSGLNIDASRSIRVLRERGARLVALRYDSGRESKGNMLRARAQFKEAETALSQAERDYRAAGKSLSRQLGLDDFGVVTATGTLAVGVVPGPPDDFAPLLARRPDLALSEAAVSSARAALARARSTIWPTLTANYSRSAVSRDPVPHTRYEWSAGGVLSLPIFGNGPTATYYASAAARKSLDAAELNLRASRNAAVEDLEGSWASFAGAEAQVGVQNALLEAARQRNDEADVRYASGLLGYDNWEIIVSDRISTERRAISARLDAVTSEAAWDRSVGRGLGE